MYIISLLSIYAASALLTILLCPKNSSVFGNLIYGLFVVGFVFYAGTPIASEKTPAYYALMYFLFLTTLSLSYNFSYKVLRPLSDVSSVAIPKYTNRYLTEANSLWVILFYMVLTLLPLIFPSFRLGLLINPPSPDLTASFEGRLSGDQSIPAIKAAASLRNVLLPFFLMALFSIRWRLLGVAIVISLVFYIEYVDLAYKSRGQLIVALFPLLFYIWYFYPRYRKLMFLATVIATPLVVQLFSFYEDYRLGVNVSVGDYSIFDSVEHIFGTETDFVAAVGVPIIESGMQVNFSKYLTWILTLPIPKFLFGSIDGARINSEISEVFLGISQNQKGFYIVLPGLIAEAVYIYGKFFFWVHAILFGFLIAFLTRIFQSSDKFIFVVGYISVLIMYNANRGGIASFLPLAVNQFLFIYIILILFAVRRRA